MLQKNNSKKLAWATIAIVTISMIHHLYGGLIYATSWRIFLVFSVLPLLGLTLYLQKRIEESHIRPFFVAGHTLILAFWILILGFWEGGSNHVLKNILYFGGASDELMNRMFPPEFGSQRFFEKPNDLFFEISGIFIFIAGIYLAYCFYQFFNEIRIKKP